MACQSQLGPSRPQPARVLPCPACAPPWPRTPLNSHLCSVGLSPGLISQPYTLAGEGWLERGSRSHWLGTCQNTGLQGVKSSPQREGLWALLPGELINSGSSQMNLPERLVIRRSKAREAWGKGRGRLAGRRWQNPGSALGVPTLLPLGSITDHSLCTTWVQRRQGQWEREGLAHGTSSLSAFKAEASASCMPFLWAFCFHPFCYSPLGLFNPPSPLTPETLLSHTTYGAPFLSQISPWLPCQHLTNVNY